MSEAYTQTSPKPLKPVFSRDGMQHRLVKREGQVAMYDVAMGGFEVIIVRVSPPRQFPTGEIASWREAYPGNEQFGTLGWYYQRREDAEAKFAETVSEQQKKVDTPPKRAMVEVQP